MLTHDEDVARRYLGEAAACGADGLVVSVDPGGWEEVMYDSFSHDIHHATYDADDVYGRSLTGGLVDAVSWADDYGTSDVPALLGRTQGPWLVDPGKWEIEQAFVRQHAYRLASHMAGTPETRAMALRALGAVPEEEAALVIDTAYITELCRRQGREAPQGETALAVAHDVAAAMSDVLYGGRDETFEDEVGVALDAAMGRWLSRPPGVRHGR